MRFQGFIVDGNRVVQRVRMASPSFPVEEGQEFIEFVAEGENIDDWDAYFEDGDWHIVPRIPSDDLTLATAISEKLTEINIKRDALWAGSCMTSKGAVNCDTASRLNISGAVAMVRECAELGIPFDGVDWTMADNSNVFHTGMEIRIMGVVVGQFIGAVQTVATALKQAVRLCSTPEEVSAIDVEGAPWPS